MVITVAHTLVGAVLATALAAAPGMAPTTTAARAKPQGLDHQHRG